MSFKTDSSQNRLASESSPYLLQHAQNPVNWFPWGKEAFQKARKENKPVLVSIGYATCHWCHVMAHESFEDSRVAKLMNDTFINIKVDREERPDIDNTYMQVCQMLTGTGGWPLNVFMTPGKEPFYAATYLPKRGRQGRPGMLELIPWLSQLWEKEPDKITNSSRQIIEAFQKSNSFEAGDGLGPDVLESAYQQFEHLFDEEAGGFGQSPKFPSPHNLMILLRYAKHHPESRALQMVEETLAAMRRGGIFDHVGLGFHRYSTDRQWLVPHFEKMLYDQAMLLLAYTEAWQLTKKELYKTTAGEIAHYVLNKMQNSEGGFYSAEDADSEGEEGKFYLWSIADIKKVLSSSEAALFVDVYNCSEEGNYKDEASGQKTGKNIPHLNKSFSRLADERDLSQEELEASLEKIRKKLFNYREKRVHPLLDDKILTSWNGLMIAALAKAGSAFNKPKYIKQAEQCCSFILEQMLHHPGRLQHRYRNGESAIAAHADDFSFLIYGLTELYQATFKTSYLKQAVELNKVFIDNFWDEGDGGFYFTSESAEKLLGRKKEIYDGALPSDNSVAMINLLRLARITGNTAWEEMVQKAHTLFSTDISKAPTGFTFALQSVDFTVNDTQEIIIAGSKKDQLTQKMLDTLPQHFLPNAVILLNNPDDTALKNLAPFLADYEMKNNTATAYVCQNYSCRLPTNDPDKMMELVRA